MRYQNHVFGIVVLFILVIFVSAIILSELEDLEYVDSFYLSVNFVTSAGNGLTPQTQNGRIFSSFLSLFGLGLFLYTVTIITHMSPVIGHVHETKKEAHAENRTRVFDS